MMPAAYRLMSLNPDSFLLILTETPPPRYRLAVAGSDTFYPMGAHLSLVLKLRELARFLNADIFEVTWESQFTAGELRMSVLVFLWENAELRRNIQVATPVGAS